LLVAGVNFLLSEGGRYTPRSVENQKTKAGRKGSKWPRELEVICRIWEGAPAATNSIKLKGLEDKGKKSGALTFRGGSDANGGAGKKTTRNLLQRN